jgi:hypothetical protein
MMRVAPYYQLAFRTPGIIPLSASSRKQRRQRPKRRRYARARPQRWQRFFTRTWYFGFRFDFSIRAFRAMLRLRYAAVAAALGLRFSSVRNGIPSSFSSANAMSSRGAVVTKVMSIPWICSISS